MDAEKQYTLEELEEKLTEKEHDLCHEYIIDWNATRAAKKAGYSEDSARQIAHATLTKDYIKQYLNLIKNDIAKEAGLSKLALLKELKLIAFSNLPAIILKYEKGGLESLTEDEQKTIVEYTNNKRELGEGTILDSTTKLKLHDKRGAIQDILKALDWNGIQKIDLSGHLSIEQITGINVEK